MQEQESVGKIGIGGLMPAREKLWVERDVEGKLEALRDQILHLLFRVEKLNSASREIHARFDSHEHVSNRIVHEIKGRDLDFNIGGSVNREPPISLRLKE